MPTLAADTTPEVEQLQLALLRQMPAWRKLQLAGGMNRMVRTLALQGLRRRYPQSSAADLQRYLAEQRLGPVLAARVYGPLPHEAQERLWFIDQLTPGRPTYTLPIALALRVQLDSATLAASLHVLITRHEVLCTTFGLIDGQPVQHIGPTPAQILTRVDLHDQHDQRDQLHALARQPFDLQRGPLLDAVFRQLVHDVAVVNIYGLTEITDINAFSVISADDPYSPVTVGQPLQNDRIYVLSEALELQPVGVMGEVCISGTSVSGGYLHHPELTAEKFVPCPFEADGVVMVRTSDQGRRDAHGRLVILGRRDQQVKLRGYRIETGEIETALLAHSQVQAALVLVREDVPGDQGLVAYVVLRDGQDLGSVGVVLRPFLTEQLPGYMVPAAFVPLAALPRTPNGKIDRSALPVPERGQTLTGTAVALRTPQEEQILALWQELLRQSSVGVTDDFLALGGRCVLGMQLIARLRKRLRIEVPLRVLFELPTLADLAAYSVAAQLTAGDALRADRPHDAAPTSLAVYAEMMQWASEMQRRTEERVADEAYEGSEL